MQKNHLFSSRATSSLFVFIFLFWLVIAVPSGADTTETMAVLEVEAEDKKTSGEDDVQRGLSATSLQTFGWIEKVILSPELKWMIDAKLDTGADTSSLDAHKIKRVRYKGKSYVRFSIENPETGEMVSLRRPYVRTVRIRRHNGNHQRRRVVLMTVCLGQVERTVEVTLTDREYFDYPMLLGRSALAGVAVVDPMSRHRTEPKCDAHTVDEQNSDDSLALIQTQEGEMTTAVSESEERVSEATEFSGTKSMDTDKSFSSEVALVRSKLDESNSEDVDPKPAEPGETESAESAVRAQLDDAIPSPTLNDQRSQPLIDKSTVPVPSDVTRAVDPATIKKSQDIRNSRLSRDNLTSQALKGTARVRS